MDAAFGFARSRRTPTPPMLPARKPGLWEVKTTIDGHGRAVTVQQCIDAATDQMLQSSAGPFAAPACPEREVKKSDDGMTIDSHCKLQWQGQRTRTQSSPAVSTAPIP